MAKQNAPLLSFNRGLVSASALSRVDVDRIRLSASLMTNWFPKTVGCMLLRPGLGYLGTTDGGADAALLMDFVAATDDTAMLEFTAGKMRVWINDALLTRGSVATTISNGSFATSASWTDASTGGGTLTFGGNGLILNATNRGGNARCTRQITVAGGDQNDEHGLRIEVSRGPVTFRCGSTSGDDDYITETTLKTGSHSLAFTPSGNFHLTFQSDLLRNVIVTSIAVESSGTVELTSPYLAVDLDYVRGGFTDNSQSADVIFVACDGYQQRRIERRGTGRSWSVVKYAAEDGPFGTLRTAKLKLKPAATFGNTTLTADKDFFKSTHVGAILRLFHSGYKGTFRLGAENTNTDAIRVSGTIDSVHNDRVFNFTISGTWTATVTLQRSVDGPDSGFVDISTYAAITANGTTAFNDEDNNLVAWYRLAIKPGNFTSGAVVIAFDYSGGGDFGICRVTGVTNSQSANVEVLKDFTGTVYTEDWREGIWSDLRGWPTSVMLADGRLTWPGRVYYIASISDAYESFDQEVEGDSAPIVRTIGSGPVDVINWALPLGNNVLGTAGAEISVKASNFGEKITPDNMRADDGSTQGSAAGIRAVKVDKRGVYVQRSKKRVFELLYDSESFDYRSKELTLLVPDLTGTATVVQIAVQRQPDTRIHFVLSSGIVAMLTYEPTEELMCWSKVETDGLIERVCVLPGSDEDSVYFVVNRTINGSTARHIEKYALESQCEGGAVNRQLDSFIVYSGASSAIMTAAHLKGETVAVWSNGVCLADANGDIATFTPALIDGTFNIPNATTSAVIGLLYTAQYRSTKLAYAAQLGTALTQKKKINHLGLVLQNTHHKGLKAGRDFNNMTNLPQVKDEAAVATNTIHSDWDQPAGMFDGSWNTDSRLCLEANAPRPCTVNAAIISVDQHERA